MLTPSLNTQVSIDIDAFCKETFERLALCFDRLLAGDDVPPAKQYALQERLNVLVQWQVLDKTALQVILLQHLARLCEDSRFDHIKHLLNTDDPFWEYFGDNEQIQLPFFMQRAPVYKG